MINKNQPIRDLIFDPRLYVEYPYHYSIKNEDGTTTIKFTKVPMMIPSMIEQAKIKKFLRNEKENRK